VSHAGRTDEFLEIFGDELRSVVGDDARCDTGVGFAGALQNGLHVAFLHLFADFMVHDEATAAVEDRAEEVESTGDVEIADIDAPVLVGR